MYCQRDSLGGYEMIFTEDDLKRAGLNPRLLETIQVTGWSVENLEKLFRQGEETE